MDQQTQASSLILTQPDTSIFDGVVFDDNTGPWLDWIEAYHAWLAAKRRKSGSEHTVAAYTIAWRQFFKFAQVRPWDVSPQLAQRWIIDLSHKNLAKRTINLKLAALSSFYLFVQANYDIWPLDKRNPFAAVERHEIDPKEGAEFPSIKEVKAILTAINRHCLTGKRDFALFYTFLVTCRRSSELLNLKWGDLKEANDGDYTFSYKCKGGKVKETILKKKCYQAIVDYLKAAGRFDTLSDDDYIFIPLSNHATRFNHIHATEKNKPISNNSVNRTLKKYARITGLPAAKAHLHSLRHAGARLRINQMRQEKGVDLEELMNLLGHANINTTFIYVHSHHNVAVDPGGQAAADELFPKDTHPRRPKKPSPSQLPLEAAISPDKLRIAELEAELTQLKNERTSQ